MPFPQKHLPQVVIPEDEYRALTYDTISAVAHKYNIAACALRRRLRDGSDNRVFVARRRPSEVFTEEELDMDWHTLYRLGKERHVLLESLQRLHMSRRLRARAQCHAAPAAATTTTTTTAAAATATPASSVGAAPQRRRQADAHATSAATARAGGSGGVATATVRWVAPLPGDGVADASLSQPPPSSLGASEHVAYDGNNSSNSNDNSNDAAAAARARNAAAAFADVMGVTARTRAWAVAYVCATTHTSLRRCASLHLLRTAQQERDDDEQQQQRLQQQASYDATSASTATDGDEGVTLPCALHAAWLRRLRPLPLSALQRCARHVMAARAVWEQQVVQPARARVAALHAHVAQQRRNALCYNVCLWQRRHPLRLVCDVLELYRTQWAADYAPACTRTADAGDACAHAATPPAVWLDELLEALTQLLCPALARIPWLVRCDVLMTYPHMQLDEQLQLMRDTARSSALRSHDRDDNNDSNDNNNNSNNNNGNNDDNNDDDNDDDAHSRMPVTPQRLLRGYVDDDVVVPDRDVHTLTDNEYAALRRGFERHKRDGVRRLCNGTYGMTRN